MPTIRDGQRRGADLAPLDFDLLLAHALRRPKAFLYTHPEYRLNRRERWRLAYGLFRYRRGWSIAAITHRKEFYGLDFYVNRHVLIPRPETELIVDEVIRELTDYVELQNARSVIPSEAERSRGISYGDERDSSTPPTKSGSVGMTEENRFVTQDNAKSRMKNREIMLIDVGTGSGCIPIAIMKASNYKNIKTIAVDNSRAALRVARRNARTHRVPINFLRGNLLTPIISYLQTNKLTGRRIIITANLPYLTPQEFAAEPSIKKEPRHALVADKNGLALYEKLLKQIQSLLPANTCSLQTFLEISPTQSSAITNLFHQLLPQATVEIKTDLAGRDRVVKITVPNC
ncbi:MAG: peptide chain release factor N(5)-glutamine methyltransferase [Candidatus Magasanikbacteria bacterium]|nr:peptide chain release factor N(5)-glutamine methyltransferase [Candidatus Magasanikbacteria bacterium]